MNNFDFNEMRIASYYRLDSFGADAIRKLLSQLLETFLDCPNSVALITLTKEELYDIARGYRDLCVGYKHPRCDSRSWHYRPNDRTLQRLYGIFPKMLTTEETTKKEYSLAGNEKNLSQK